MACQESVDLAKTVTVVDEADTMLNVDESRTSSIWTSEKGLMNRCLDNCRGSVIWIVNRIDEIDESTRRRFDYSIRFERAPASVRQDVWRRAARRYRVARLLSDADIRQLAEKYEVSAGVIDLALRNLADCRGEFGGERQATTFVSRLLTAHATVTGRAAVPSAQAHCANDCYCLEGLHVEGDVERTLCILERFSRTPADRRPTAIRSLALLLYGPPGTGKTEFARYVARRLDRPFMLLGGTEVLDMWVGSTEHHIRSAFAQAMGRGAILFIDEIDTLLASRQNAQRSWEVSQVNELLTSMDRFEGIVIGATNNRDWIDAAAIRRFSIKLGFGYLTSEGTALMYEKVLGPLCPVAVTPSQRDQLRQFSRLTPGDLRTVYQTHSLIEPGQVTHDVLIEALQREIAEKKCGTGRKMGMV
jgi:transitional endoplasmic reticulum ATPase